MACRESNRLVAAEEKLNRNILAIDGCGPVGIPIIDETQPATFGDAYSELQPVSVVSPDLNTWSDRIFSLVHVLHELVRGRVIDPLGDEQTLRPLVCAVKASSRLGFFSGRCGPRHSVLV